MATIKDSRSSARDILATNMKALRAEQKLSQEDLALECELHRTFIAHVERGVRNISLDNIEKIADALGVPVHRLLTPVVAPPKRTR
jgi:transcriptional regulator with XRE-family HTH domain